MGEIKKRKGMLAASMMCAGLDKIFYYISEFKSAGLEYLHIDIMDGEFVPNFALGTDYVKSLRRISDIPFDYHFLVVEPVEKMSWFDIREGDNVSFHIERNDHVAECIQAAKRLGATSFIAINPETPVEVCDPYLNDIDGVLCMTVKPGFAGKKLEVSTLDKVKKAREYFDSIGKSDLKIEVDGNISIENAAKFYERGADIYVAGSSSLFKKCELDVAEIIRQKRLAIGWSEQEVNK